MLRRIFQVLWLGTIAWAIFWVSMVLRVLETDSATRFLEVTWPGVFPMLVLGLLVYIVRPS